MPNVEISVDEFLSDCSSRELKKLIKTLAQDGHLIGYSTITGEFDASLIRNKLIANTNNFDEHVFEKSLIKLQGKWNCLSHGEEEIINKIASRF